VLKPGEFNSFDYQAKFDFYKDLHDDTEIYVDKLNAHNCKFKETHHFKNKFNTMVAYPGSKYHRANSFQTNKGPRLTQVFFINVNAGSHAPSILFRK